MPQGNQKRNARLSWNWKNEPRNERRPLRHGYLSSPGPVRGSLDTLSPFEQSSNSQPVRAGPRRENALDLQPKTRRPPPAYRIRNRRPDVGQRLKTPAVFSNNSSHAERIVRPVQVTDTCRTGRVRKFREAVREDFRKSREAGLSPIPGISDYMMKFTQKKVLKKRR